MCVGVKLFYLFCSMGCVYRLLCTAKKVVCGCSVLLAIATIDFRVNTERKVTFTLHFGVF